MNREPLRKRRIFFALPVDVGDSAEMRKLRDEFVPFRKDIRIVPPDNYHITLKFLGPVDDEICMAMADAFMIEKMPVKAIPYRLKGTGAFPSPGRPSVIWCGFDTDNERVRELVSIIEGLAGRFSFPPDSRPFSPHLTVARVRKDARPPKNLVDLITGNSERLIGESRFDRIVLYESELKPTGPVYTALETRNLE